MITPREFSEKTGITYAQVRIMAQRGEIKCTITPGGKIKIFESELDRVNSPSDYVHIDEYNRVANENIKLKMIIQAINKVSSCIDDVENEEQPTLSLKIQNLKKGVDL